jgi:membrane fusion protein, multidrug efflux system
MDRIATPPKLEGDPLIYRRSGRVARVRQVWFWVLLLVIAGATAYFIWAKSGTSQQRAGQGPPGGAGRSVPVAMAPATTRDVDVYLNGLGSVTPLNVVTVKTRVDGQLMRLLFREGQMVEAGDLLAEIDPRPFQVQLTQAEGQMARDVALLRNAEIDLARYQTLFEQDSVAKQQLDTQAALVRQYEGTVKSDQGQIDSARLQLTYSRITAPISGRLGLRQVDPGNIVQASDTTGLVVITQLQPIAVTFTLPEDTLPGVMKKLQAGEPIRVDAYDRAGKTKLASGSLLTVDNQIDAATGTVKLKAQFPNGDFALFPNQFVNVRMLVDVKRNATVIPIAAVQRGTQGTFVYVVAADDTVSVRPIGLGPAEGEVVAVESGLAPGDRVVVDGTDKLREGAKVEPAERAGATAPNAGPKPERRRRRDGAASPGN